MRRQTNGGNNENKHAPRKGRKKDVLKRGENPFISNKNLKSAECVPWPQKGSLQRRREQCLMKWTGGASGAGWHHLFPIHPTPLTVSGDHGLW